ncbi:hypothetical protein GC176_17800 [bacterium]|nr:hypothetical protein [bacterium]
MPLRQIAVASCLIAATNQASLADLPAPRFDRLKPLGAAAGTSIEVEIAGADIEGVESLLFDHPGLTATRVAEKDRFFQIAIAADVSPGTYDVYLVGRFGVSNPRLFAVSSGLTDVADNGDNREPAKAQSIEVNLAVNGTIDGNAEDFYRVALKKGQRVVIDCQAQRLDSELDATMTLTSATGSPLASSGDYYGQDPMIDYVAPSDGDVIIALHDLSYRGGYPYRLVVSDRPQIENVFPPVLQIGQPATLTAFGRNLVSIGGVSGDAQTDGSLPLDRLEFSVAAPSTDFAALRPYEFISHPTHHSVLPTAATCTLAGLQVRPDNVRGVWDAQPVLVTADPVTLETEPNDTQDAAQALTLPAIVAGRFNQPRDADWFAFQVDENGPHSFDVYCERIAGRADAYLVIVDENGNRVQELDDFGHRMNAFDGHLRDPSQVVNLSKDRQYKVLVQDRYQRGGERYQYVLEIRKPQPDFFVAAIHRSNQNPAGTTVFTGGATYVDIVIHQKSYSGPLTISAEGLPPGVHFQPTGVPNNSRGNFVLWADEDAAEWTGFVRLFATGEIDGQQFRREVRPYSRVWNNSGTSQPQRSLALAVRASTPFNVSIVPEKFEIEAGKSAELSVELKRLWPDFKEKVTIQPLNFPGQFKLGNFDIQASETSKLLKIDVQPNTPPGEYTLALQCQAQVPFNKDPAAKNRPNTLVTLPSRPVTLKVLSRDNTR